MVINPLTKCESSIQLHYSNLNITYSIMGKRTVRKRNRSKLNLKKYVILNKKEVNILYDITKKTIDILDKYKIDYWATDGTLLGSKRNKGFIPWDDDVDIAIDVKDTSRLKELKGVFKEKELDLVGVGKYMKVKTPETKKVWIDIFLLKNGVWLQKQFYNLRFMKGEIYPLKKGRFGPFMIKIPNKSDKYLHRVFPGWKEYAYVYNHQMKSRKQVFFRDNSEILRYRNST